MATRWRLAAREFVWLVHHAGAEIDGFKDSLGAGDAFGGGVSRCRSAGARRLWREVARARRLNVWKDESDFLIADAGKFVVVQFRGRRGPLSQYLPLVGESRQPMRFISVDLPEPEGTHDGDILVVFDPKVYTAQGVDLLIAHLVSLPEIVGGLWTSPGSGAVGVWAGFGGKVLRLLLWASGSPGEAELISRAY